VQDLAEPLMYRHLEFRYGVNGDGLNRLQRAAHTFRFPGQSEKISRWTRTFSFDFGNDREESDSAVNAATAIALHARQLVELQVSCWAPPDVLLATVAVVSPASLRSLDLSWEMAGMPALMLSYIGAFVNLQTLKLEAFDSDQAILPGLLSLDEVDGWTLPKLEKLDINLEELEDRQSTSIQLLRYLSRCVLGRTNSLCLRLDGLVSGDASALQAFFGHHRALTQCSLSIKHKHEAEGAADISRVALLHADATCLQLSCIPKLREVETLNPRLRVLCISLNVGKDLSHLKAFMTALGDNRRQGAEPLHLHFRWFRWTPADMRANYAQNESPLQELMCRHAYYLRSRGIVVLDDSGYTFDRSRFEVPAKVRRALPSVDAHSNQYAVSPQLLRRV
jgi:hypothetical protein